MPHVLAMAASQIGHPIPLLILMIADNGLFHGATPSRSTEILLEGIEQALHPDFCERVQITCIGGP